MKANDETRIIDMGFSQRAFNVLIRYMQKNIKDITVGDVKKDKPRLKTVKGCGLRTMVEITEKMKEQGADVTLWEEELLHLSKTPSVKVKIENFREQYHRESDGNV